MADEKQQQLPDELPANYFDLPPDQQQLLLKPGAKRRPAKMPDELPPDYFEWTPEQQQDYLRGSNVPRVGGELALQSLPYLGAAGATMLAPEGLPFWASWAATTGLAGAGMGTGKGLQIGGEKAFGLEDQPRSFGESAREVGGAAAEGALTELGGRVVFSPLEWAISKLNPMELYQRGLKPAGISQKEAEPVVRAGIREGIPLSKEGAEKAAKRIEELNNEIETMIANSPTDITPKQYVKNLQIRFDELRKKWGKVGLRSKDYLKELDAAEKDFLVAHGGVKPLRQFKGRDAQGNPIWKTLEPEDMDLPTLRARAQPMTAENAQRIKKSTWEDIRSRKKAKGGSGQIPGFGPGTHPPLQLEAEEELGRMLREELGNIPGNSKLHALNAAEGDMIELDIAIDRYLKREMNKQWLPYFIFPAAGAALGYGGGGAEGGGLGAAAGIIAGHMVRSALEDPGVKAGLAIALDRAGKKTGAGLVRRAGRAIPGTAARYVTGVARSMDQPLTTIEPVQEYQPPGEPAAPAAGRGAALGGPRAAAAPPRLNREISQAGGAIAPGWSNEHRTMLANAARDFRIPLPALSVVATQEGSGGDPNAVSKKGAIGLMQVMPKTAAEFGYSKEDLKDPKQNIAVAARFWKELQDPKRYPEIAGKMNLMLAAYNAGPQAVKDAGYNIAKLSKETRDYVARGMQQWRELTGFTE